MAEPNYYYNKDGQPTGPISVVELKALADSGQIKPNDLVWREGTPNWVAASTVKGLFGSVTPPTAVPPTPPPVSRPPAMGATAPTSSAGTPPPGPTSRVQSEDARAAAEYARQASQKAREASQQAWGAVKTLVADPVGGIGQVYEQMGEKGSLAVGTVFAVVYLLCPILGSIIGRGSAETPLGYYVASGDGWFKHTIFGLITDAAMIATMVGISYLYRLKTHAAASVGADMLIVGAALLPIGIARLVTAPLYPMNLIWISLFVFAGCFCVMLLFSGLTKISRLSERLATVAVPLMLVVAVCVVTLLNRLLWQV